MTAFRAAIRLPALCAAVLALHPRPAAAEWHLTPMIGITFGGTTSIVDPQLVADKKHWNFGGAVRFIGPGLLGVEGLFVYMPGFFDGTNPDLPPVASSRSFALMGNVVLSVPSRNRYGLRPFLSGGIGLLQASWTDLRDPPILPAVNEKLTGYNIGGGAVGFLSDRTGVRFELRHFGTLIPTAPPSEAIAFGNTRLRYWVASAGVVFRY